MTTRALALPGFFTGSPRVKTESRVRRRAASPADIKYYLAVGLAVLATVMLMAYIFGINQSAAKGYEISKAKAKLSLLQEENQKLQIRLAEAGSIAQIQTEATANHLVQITSQEYLQDIRLSQR